MPSVRRPLSLALRLTLLFGVAAAIVFPGFGLLILQSTERHFVAEDSDELMVVADAVGDLVRETGTVRELRALDQRFADILIGHHSAALRLQRADGQVVYASRGPDLAPMITGDVQPDSAIREWRDDEHSYRVLTRSLIAPDGSGELQLIVAVPIDHHLRFLREFRRDLWMMVGCSIAIISLMGWIAVRQGHAPLHNIVDKMRRISADKLGTRLSPDSVPAELKELTVSFNEMLERVDGAFQRLSEFNANIAHELRTPIANLRTQTEVGLTRARTADEYREILYSNMEEYERMAQMVGDMLYLAKADSHPQLRELTTLELAKEVGVLFEFYEGWAEECGVSLRCEGDATMTGDRSMIQRALGNLVSNAIRHTPRGGTILVQLRRDPRSTRIVVENPGPSIPAEHISRLFDRFYRTDESRQKGDQGVGLGLAIVKSIVNAHRGKIQVESADGITRFTVSLPDSGGAHN